MKNILFNLSAILTIFSVMTFSSCKKEFDEPPIADLPNLEGTATIQSVIALAAPTPVALGDLILEATVIADDKSGNFYKQLVIQDSTGGIRLDIDAYSIYTDFPIGRKVWVKCEGLYAWRDGDVPAIVGSSNPDNSRIPQSTYKQFIIGGEYDQPLMPTVKSLTTLNALDYYTLIEIENVEFADCFAGSTYANPVTQESNNAELTDCATGAMVIVRNSGYADFAGELMPTGNGSIVAVFNSYNGTPQLLIRDPSDVESMTGTRCNPIGNYNLISIADLRAQFTGASTLADGKIRGIVISDNTSGQWQNQNLVVQEANGSGITIRFTTAHSYMMNDYVEVKVGGGTLEEYNGLLQVNNLDLCRASQLINSGNISITPRVATVTDILANGDNWESTLVNVQNADLSGGTTYGDFGVMLNDATGSIAMFSGFANFGATALPTGTGDVTAVVGDYNATQLNIRNLDDVNITGSGGGGGGGGGGGSEAPISDIRAMFASGTTTVPASTTIAGIVISDKDQGNITARNIVIQNTAGSGIVVRFDNDNTTIAMGDSVTIDVSGGTLSEYNGLLQISNLPNTTASIISSGNNLTPRVTTVTDILANSENWESTLIKVMSVNIVGSTTYSGVTTVDDGSDSIDLYTRSAATFSANPLPGGQVDVTAIVSQFNTPQINLRTINDVQ